MSEHPRVSRFQVLFESALRDYETQTGITLANHPLAEKLQTCQSAEAVTTLLQEQARAFSESRERDKITGLLKNVVSVLSKISATAVLGQGFGTSLPPADAIHTGLGILLNAFQGVISDFESAIELLESIESFLNRLDIYTKVPPTPAMTEIIVKIMVELLSTLALATSQIRQGRPKKFVKKLFGENDVNAVLRRLDRLTQDEARTTAAQTLEVVYGLFQNMRVVMDNGKASAENTRVSLEIMQQIANEMKKSKYDKLKQDIRSWLSPPDPWKNHNIACGSRHIETAAWFIGGSTFSEWTSSGPSSLLWVHGKPGAGKSVLCSTIIENIDSMRKSGLVSLAFFYCDFREDEKKDLRGLLSSVLVQLCDQSDSYYQILSNFFSEHANGSRHPSDDELVRCLKEVTRVPGQAPVYLIVDGLDECSNTSAMPSPREKVLAFLKDLIDSQLPNLSMCVTSRPEIDIKRVLEPLTFHSISLHDESGQIEDIKKYIKSVVNTDPKMRRWTAADRELVIDVLIKKSEGMFQWVHCQIAYLRGCLPGRIRHALDKLPDTLDGTYDRALRDIDETNWELAHSLLQCVAVAFRPFRVEELAEILSFDFNTEPIPSFHEGWRLEDPIDAVLSTTSSLLVIVEDNWGPPIVQFSHFSVKEFLTSTRLAETNDIICRRYHISMTPAHTIITQSCLGILLHLDIDVVTRESLGEYPLVEYAARHWVDHARFQGVSGNVEDGMERLFDPSKPHLAIWVWIYDPLWSGWDEGSGTERPLQPRGSPLHYAVVCGLHTIVKFLVIQHTQDLHSQYFDGTFTLTPLHVAAREGHEDVARFLLEQGADVTIQTNEGWTPASRHGNEDVAAQMNDGTTPLHLALRGGHKEVARLLLEYGADVTAKTSIGLTPLHLALELGHGNVARLLLERGADSTIQTYDGSTPLHLLLGSRITKASVETVRLLLEYGADITSTTNNGWTLLHLASRDGSEDVTCLLLEHGADVTARASCGSTPLHVASLWGNEEVTRLLLEHDADATAQDFQDFSPLHLALEWGYEKVIDLLLRHGADLATRTNDGSTPLHIASKKGHDGVVCMLLLDHGADATAQTNDGSTPLHIASQQGYKKVTSLLLEHNADVIAQTNDGSTPLHLASHRGHEEIAYLLLAYGAHATARTNYGSTPLHLASEMGHGQVAYLLLQHGADVTAQTNDGSTPLHIASQWGIVEIVLLLLEHGADATAENIIGLTPLSVALEWGQEAVTHTLLEWFN